MPRLLRRESYSRSDVPHILDNKVFDFTSEVPPDYKCPLCHSLLRDPIQLNTCGHRFCNSCYLRHLGNGSSKLCPIDRKSFKESEVFQDRAWRNTIMSLRVRCKFKSCPWTGTLNSLLEDHAEECEYEDVKCPDPNCNVVMARSRIENHQARECQWRVVVCDYCEDKYAVCKEEVHKATCRGVPEKCLNGCSSRTIPRGQMRKHVENECPLTILPCQYRHVGCDDEILRHQMQDHLDKNLQKHLDHACGKIREMGADLREKTLQLNQHSEKLAILAAEQARNMTGNGTIVWVIDNFEIRFRQAVNGIEPILQSEAALTGPFGYKFRSLVYLNGDAKAKGSCISVYIQLLKGDHDSLLRWPFQQEVKFTLIDQQNDHDERKNIVKVLAPAGNNEGIVNFQRPIKSCNTGRGYAKFVPHDVIRTRRYIRDDVMFLKIEVEPTVSV
ncbi:TNF receptor-associated factor 5-like isoform X1 [Dendronephthya gigantea]|uniref:TNF receptor-associated factor 5-like isoform X1 n=2 Tax=Dendronephthya gigantea TaxID=151771 RepID=UPI0010697B91|nr:TNF receptor-associated factor 5-like isoform X1 [Dendronephthya gigantea]